MNFHILSDDRVVMKLPDGSEHVIQNSELIPAYYWLPGFMLMHYEKDKHWLTRKPSALFQRPEHLELIESNLFREAVCEGMAQLAWIAMDMSGWIKYYSPDAPQRIMAYDTESWLFWLQQLRIMKTNRDLFSPPECDTYQEDLWVYFADMMMEEIMSTVFGDVDPWKVLEACKEMPCEEDFNLEVKNHNRRLRNFWRKWYHWRTKHPDFYYGVIVQNTNYPRYYSKIMTLAAEDDTEEEVVADLHGKAFYDTLSPTDQKIIYLRGRGYTLEQIANQVGYATHSAIHKRIQRIGRAYELWSGEDLGFRKKQEMKPYFDYDAIRRQKRVV